MNLLTLLFKGLLVFFVAFEIVVLAMVVVGVVVLILATVVEAVRGDTTVTRPTSGVGQDYSEWAEKKYREHREND